MGLFVAQSNPRPHLFSKVRDSEYLRSGDPYTLTMNSPSTVAGSVQEKPFSVSAPFNSDTGADVILRTCDGHRFLVRKSIITLVSSIFDDMFSLPQPKAAENQQQLEDGLPVVDLSEAGPIIDTLLRFCCPFMNPSSFLESSTDDNVIAVHSAAVKYNMASIELSLSPLRLKRPKFLLILYKSACDRRLWDKATAYARDCLRLPLKLIVELWPSPFLDQWFKSLVAYHQSVLVAQITYLLKWDQVKKDVDIGYSASHCTCTGKPGNSQTVPGWWKDNIEKYMLNVTEKGPIYTFCDRSSLSICGSCASYFFKKWDAFAGGIERGTDREAAKVR